MEEKASARNDSFQASFNSESSSDYDSSSPSSASTNHSSSIDLEIKTSNLRQINTFPRNKADSHKAKLNSNSHGLSKSGKVLTKTNSMRPVRILAKMVSFRAKKPSTRNSIVNKATCSSTFKNSKFPKDVDIHHIGESEGLSAMRPCTYTYCSLHGHHRDPAPPLKRFVSIRRRALKSQRSIKPKIRPLAKSKNLGNAKKVTEVNKIGNSSIFINNHWDITEEPFSELQEVGSCYIESKGEKSDADNLAFSNVSASVRERLSDRLLEGLPPLWSSARNRTTAMEKDKFISMWSLLHKSVSSGKVSTQLHPKGDNNQENISGQDIENKKLDLGNEKIERDAIKLVEAAIDEILFPEVEDQLSDLVSTMSNLNSKTDNLPEFDKTNVDQEKTLVTADNITTTTEEKKTMQPGPKNWSKLKKVILFRRFIKALDKVRHLNFTEPQHLPLAADQGTESVKLRRQTSEERKNVEEWMLDYALRQVVSNLTPNRRRKVELLVEAFETVIPVGNVPRINLKPHVLPLAKTKFDLVNHDTQATDPTNGKGDKNYESKHDTQATDNYSSSVHSDSQGPNLKPHVFPLAKTKLDLMNLVTQATDTDGKDDKKYEPRPDGQATYNYSGSVHSRSQSPILREESLQKRDDMAFQEGNNKIISSARTISLQVDNGLNNEDAEKFDQMFRNAEDVEPECETGEPYKTQMEKQRYMKMWRVIYTQVVTGSANKFGNDSNLIVPDVEKNSDLSGTDRDIGVTHHTMHQKIEFNQIEAIKLVEKAIDEIVIPENEDQSSDDISIINDIASDKDRLEQKDHPSNHFSNNKFGQIKSKFSALRNEGPKDDVIVMEQERIKQRPNKWSNLKKLILLNRFVKALDKVREFNPRGPQFLPMEDDPELENVKLRHQTTLERKKGEEWMIDNAIQQVVARLTPARKRRVELLVEAFETVTPLSNIGTTPTKHSTGHQIWSMRSPREANHSVKLTGSSQVYE